MSGIPSWARVGANVVCINATPHPGQTGPRWFWMGSLTVGAVYTIRAVGAPTHTGAPGVYLNEIVRPADPSLMAECGYNLCRFRPAVEPKSDNEIEAQIYHRRGLHQRTSRKSRADA